MKGWGGGERRKMNEERGERLRVKHCKSIKKEERYKGRRVMWRNRGKEKNGMKG